MIVKNEEKNLAACLESVADFATEIIIVDTGSTDRTVDLARAWGATVKHFDWIDDFAAARNESIKDATGDWIFWMDADDRLSPDNLNRLKQAAASDEADGYICGINCRAKTLDQVETKVSHLRLFRNRTQIRFENPLHEDATPSAERQGLILAFTNIEIDHIGYAIDQHGLRAKARRNQVIIEKQLQQEPSSLRWRFYLAVNQYTLEEWAAAVKNFEAVLADPPPYFALEDQLYQAQALLISAYNALSQPLQVQEALERALQLYPYRQHLYILAGKFCLAQNKPEQAVRMLEHARQLAPDSVGLRWPAGVLDRQLSRAYVQQAQHFFKRGQYAQTTGWCAKALATAPCPAEQVIVYKLLAATLQKQGQTNEAIWCWQQAAQLTPP
jgi:tetratricopeptide (TPR) repeat protein